MVCPIEKVTLSGWPMVYPMGKLTLCLAHGVPHREGYSLWVVRGVPYGEAYLLYVWSMVYPMGKLTLCLAHGVPHTEGYSLWVVHGVPYREAYSMRGPWCTLWGSLLYVWPTVCPIQKVTLSGWPMVCPIEKVTLCVVYGVSYGEAYSMCGLWCAP